MTLAPPEDAFLRDHVRHSLAEDLGGGDVTTRLLQETPRVTARLVAREEGVLAGRRAAELAFREAPSRAEEPGWRFDWSVRDGQALPGDGRLVEIAGPLDGILTGERVALNYLGQLSGTAAAVRRLVKIAAPHGVDVYDTRKTVPHLRRLQKYAVRCGGGRNHRLTLADAVMIKDNHKRAAGGVVPLLERLEKDTTVVVEIHDLHELEEPGLLDGPDPAIFDIDVIMLDNVATADLGEYLAALPESVSVEVSGGLGPGNLEEYCRAGVDRVSVGSPTHSFSSLDVSLRIES